MSEPTPSPSVWKKPWQFLCKHTEEAFGLAIAGGIVGTSAYFGAQLWQWLISNIRDYPAQVLCLIALGTTAFCIQKWLQWKAEAKNAFVKMSEFASRTDILEDGLSEKEQRIASLEAANANLRVPENPLSQYQSRTFRCILCAGEITLPNIVIQVGFEHHIVKEAVQALRHDLSLVRRAGINDNGEELFALSEPGKQFAIDHRIPAIDQGDQVIQQTIADAEKRALREHNVRLEKSQKALDSENILLQEALATMRKMLADERAASHTTRIGSNLYVSVRGRINQANQSAKRRALESKSSYTPPSEEKR